MKFDFLGQLIGKAARRRLEREVASGGGPVLDAVRPLVAPIIQAELARVQGQVLTTAEEKINGIVHTP